MTIQILAQFFKFLLSSRLRNKSALALSALHLLWLKLLGSTGPGYFRLAEWRVHYGDFDIFFGMVWEIFILPHYQMRPPFPVRRVIDAGANIGLTTLLLSSEFPESKIICFEPEPRNFALLKDNVEANGLAGRVDLHNCALGDSHKTLRMFGRKDVAGGDGGFSSDRDLRLHFHRDERLEPTDVPCVPLSSFLTEPVDLLKIDIEGGEREVFPEIAPHFGQVGGLLMEYHHSPQGLPLSEVLRLMETHQHKYMITGLTPIDAIDAGIFELNIKSHK